MADYRDPPVSASMIEAGRVAYDAAMQSEDPDAWLVFKVFLAMHRVMVEGDDGSRVWPLTDVPVPTLE